MSQKFRVTITRKAGLSDPEGSTTHKALTDLGFDEVTAVSFGRIITLTIDADDPAEARERLDAMCTKLLANPVMERYEIEALT
ncbi:MAG: phosphoribosylformylglycinamidine synthase subunit PurS [Acidimicrobiia bacterium]